MSLIHSNLRHQNYLFDKIVSEIAISMATVFYLLASFNGSLTMCSVHHYF